MKCTLLVENCHLPCNRGFLKSKKNEWWIDSKLRIHPCILWSQTWMRQNHAPIQLLGCYWLKNGHPVTTTQYTYLVSPVSLMITAAFLLYNVLLTIFSLVTETEGCHLPNGWVGNWFQSGVHETITIRGNTISTKGRCLEGKEEKFLLFNE